MRFDQAFLDEIRARLPVSQVVAKRVKLKRQGREFIGLSPFKQEKTPSFTVNDQKGFYHCFASGEHGDIFKFLQVTEGLSFPEAVERLAGEVGTSMSVPSLGPEMKENAQPAARSDGGSVQVPPGGPVTDEYDDREAFFNRRTDKTIVSKGFTDNLTGQRLRIASHVFESGSGLKFATVKDEMVLRLTPAGRFEIKATLLEDDRSIKTLTIQRYSNKSGPLDKQHFSFVGSEIDDLIDFFAGVRTVPLPEACKVHLSDEVLRDIVLDQSQARGIFAKNPELFLQLAQQEDITRDLVAVGYRRKQLQRFKSLLLDADFFASERKRLQCRPEDVWQKFFEANTWIFGYGLSYQFLSKLDGRKLEQIVRGCDLTGAGKRADALMKTRGIISSLCFVENKCHDTSLLASTEYRSDAWRPSPDLAGGVSQVQTSVHGAIESIGHKLAPREDKGNPTGEELFNIEPRSCLVIGSLAEFQTEKGINVPKFRSFELYRRNTWRPEIITFDELFERARFIVDHVPDTDEQQDDEDKEVPF